MELLLAGAACTGWNDRRPRPVPRRTAGDAPFSSRNRSRRGALCSGPGSKGNVMKIATKLAIATAIAALGACSSNNNANNSADLNAGTDLNSGSADMNATSMNGMGDMNATGNTGLNAAGGGAGTTGTTNATGHAPSNAAKNSYGSA